MSHWKAFGLAIFAVVCLVGGMTGPAHAQCNDGCAIEWSGGGAVNLGGLPGATYSIANGINDSGQAVGSTAGPDFEYAVEWSGGHVVNLGGLPGFVDSVASSINNAGQVVGVSYSADGEPHATEWSGGRVINLGGLPESVFSAATAINDSGQAKAFNALKPESNFVATKMFGGRPRPGLRFLRERHRPLHDAVSAPPPGIREACQGAHGDGA
jgi:probable HAF family extracellular repeat protein